MTTRLKCSDQVPERMNEKLPRREFFKKSGTAVASTAALVGSLTAYNSYAKDKPKTKKHLAIY